MGKTTATHYVPIRMKPILPMPPPIPLLIRGPPLQNLPGVSPAAMPAHGEWVYDETINIPGSTLRQNQFIATSAKSSQEDLNSSKQLSNGLNKSNSSVSGEESVNDTASASPANDKPVSQSNSAQRQHVINAAAWIHHPHMMADAAYHGTDIPGPFSDILRSTLLPTEFNFLHPSPAAEGVYGDQYTYDGSGISSNDPNCISDMVANMDNDANVMGTENGDKRVHSFSDKLDFMSMNELSVIEAEIAGMNRDPEADLALAASGVNPFVQHTQELLDEQQHLLSHTHMVLHDGSSLDERRRSSTDSNCSRRSRRTSNRIWQCFVAECGKLFRSGAGLRYHLSRTHNTITPRALSIRNKPRPWECDQCNKCFSTAAGLRYHNKTTPHDEDS